MSEYKTLSYDSLEYYKKLGVAYDYNEKDIEEYKSRDDFMYLFLDPQFKPRLYYADDDIYMIAVIEIPKKRKENNIEYFYIYTHKNTKTELLIKTKFVLEDVFKDYYCAKISINVERYHKLLYIELIYGVDVCGTKIEETFTYIFYISALLNIRRFYLTDTSNFYYKKDEKDYAFSAKFVRYFLNYPKELISIYNKFGFKHDKYKLDNIIIPFPNEITIKEILDGFKEIKDNFNKIKIYIYKNKEYNDKDMQNYNIKVIELCDYLEKNLDITFEKFIKDRPDLFNVIHTFSNKNITYGDKKIPLVLEKLNKIYSNLHTLDTEMYLELPIRWFENIQMIFHGGQFKFNTIYIIIFILLILLFLIYVERTNIQKIELFR